MTIYHVRWVDHTGQMQTASRTFVNLDAAAKLALLWTGQIRQSWADQGQPERAGRYVIEPVEVQPG